MIAFVAELSDDEKDEFSKECIEVLEDGTSKFVRSKAKKWLVEKFDGKDVIEWVGRPVKKEKKLSNVELVLSWRKK